MSAVDLTLCAQCGKPVQIEGAGISYQRSDERRTLNCARFEPRFRTPFYAF